MTRLQFLQSFIAAGITAGQESLVSIPDHLTVTAIAAEFTADPDIAEWLTVWQAAVITPITAADDDPDLQLLLSHQQRQQSLEIHYHGGTMSATTLRKITPILVFEKAHYPAIYLLAWCHHRQQARTFLVDKISRPHNHPQN